MAQDTFPKHRPRALGHFWRAGDDPEKATTGLLTVEGRQVTLELVRAIVSRQPIEQQSDGTSIIRAPEWHVDMTILGDIPWGPGRVSLWGTNTTRLQGIGIFVGMGSRHENQMLQSSWCLAGEHLTDPQMRFLAAEISVTNDTEWLRLPAVAHVVSRQLTPQSWTLDLPDSLDVALGDGRGYLTATTTATIPQSTLRGFGGTTRTALGVELSEGWTLQEVRNLFAIPVTSLMTLLSGGRCATRELSVWSGQRWSTVHGEGVEPEAPENSGELLFGRHSVGLELISTWMRLHERISPVPQIVAAATAGEFQTTESEALAMVTGIEALHRLLHPDSRRFSEEDVASAQTAIGSSDMPASISESFTNALRDWWFEDSYPMRVAALAEPVAEAVPDCIGRLNKWKAAVVQLRHDLAHGLGGEFDEASHSHRKSLVASIRWMLTLRMLLEAGVEPEVLDLATSGSDRFARDSARWKAHWPKVFAPAPEV